MAIFKIPVQYEVYGEVEVEASSLEEAIQYAKNNIEDLPLADEPEYIDGSYQINDDMNLIKDVNGIK